MFSPCTCQTAVLPHHLLLVRHIPSPLKDHSASISHVSEQETCPEAQDPFLSSWLQGRGPAADGPMDPS